ncbi:MAG: acylphosphatase [Selenomonadaceae bacterium]
MEDGTVTMELQGTTDQLAQLTAKIRAGSFFIKVEQLQLSDVTVVKGETVFEIRY